MILAVLPAVAILLWFRGRARLGARVRALAGVRLRIGDRARAFIARIRPLRVCGAALGGFVAGGVAFACVGAAGAVVAEPVLRARAKRKHAVSVDAQLPDALRSLASALRAGRSLPQALEAAREASRQPLREALDAAIVRLGVGGSIEDAIEAFGATAGTQAARTAAETMRIGRTSGANLPVILDVAVTSIAERARLDRDRRASTSQARLSALVIGAMPAALFVLAGSGARQQLRFLTHDPLGWTLLAGGVVLEGGGALWMRAVLR
ncbi:MAG: type II secretion system F family protein [Actinomycetota bacterium]